MANRFEQFIEQPAKPNRFLQFASPEAGPQVPFYVEDNAGQEVNVNRDAETRAEFDEAQRLQDEARAKEQAAFDASRTPMRRVLDASTFAVSAPVRMATKGEYGLGDVVGKASPEAGRIYSQSESDFARANATGLELAGAVGDVAMGIPAFSTMGAASRGIQTTGRALAAKPGIAETRAAITAERLTDADAFRRAGVRPFGPAMTESGTAGAVKQLSEVPIVGAPLRKALRETVEQTRDAGERVASEYGNARNYREAGLSAQRGLERFKDARPGEIVEESIQAMPDEQLRGIIGQRARDTSAKTRLSALYERAWRGVPEHMREGRTEKDRSRFGGQMTETRKVLTDITERNSRMVNTSRLAEEGNAVARPVQGGLAGRIVDDILADHPPTFMLQDMRNIRSAFRRLASGIADTEKNTLTRADMDRIQGAMTQDLVRVLERNRAMYAAKPGQTFVVRSASASGPAVSLEGSQVASQIDRAIIDFRRADQAARRNAELLDKLDRLYKTETPEGLAQNVLRDAQGGTKGNYNRLFALRRALKTDEWNDFASGLIREMGTPVRSARGIAQDAGFSVQTFLTNWRGLDPKAKELLFASGKDKAHFEALNNFARVADKMANFEALVNSSRTATNLINFGALAAGGGLALSGNIPAVILGGLGTSGVAAFLGSKAYANWLTRGLSLATDPRQMVSPSAYMRQLAKIAAKDPGSEAKFAAQNLLRQLDEQGSQATGDNRQPATP